MHKWRTAGLLIAALSTAAFAQDQPQVKQAAVAPANAPNKCYVSNREPLSVSPFVKLPIGSIKPGGWLRHELQMEADGMTGHLEEISQWCNFDSNAWVDPNTPGKPGWEEL